MASDLHPTEVAKHESLAARAATAAEAEAEAEADEDDEEVAPSRRFLWFKAVPGWLVSMIVHLVGIIILALTSVGGDVTKVTTILSAVPPDPTADIETLDIPKELTPLEVQDVSAEPTPMPVSSQMVDVAAEVEDIATPTSIDSVAVKVDLVEFSEQTAPKNDLMKEIGSMTGSALEGRSAKARAKLVTANGGTAGSEQAVAHALRWLAEHQLPNGSWSFAHQGGRCQGRCTHAGSLADCPAGATAMALLPFLGSGQTHQEGDYKQVVGAGLAFLIKSMQPNGSLMQGGGSMYGHGIGAIVLCEAYAMTHDRQLMAPAQASLAFISYAQDPVGGGWRYQPRTPGDTSVVGWQLMAMKSGHMAYLQVPQNTVAGAVKFLNLVQSDGGARYGYTSPGGGPGTSAVGLLCRMYLGWKKDHAALKRGVGYLSAAGPSPDNVYFNYYATQVLRHWGGEEWEKWNTVMREQLVTTQNRNGHMVGSWDPIGEGHANERGGRLYVTAMSTMILEVYYRHLPIYGKEAAEEDFPL